MRDPALAKAIEKAGGVNAVARKFGIKPASVSGWERTPAERVLELERMSGVSRHHLRKDLYPREKRANGAPA